MDADVLTEKERDEYYATTFEASRKKTFFVIFTKNMEEKMNAILNQKDVEYVAHTVSYGIDGTICSLVYKATERKH